MYSLKQMGGYMNRTKLLFLILVPFCINGMDSVKDMLVNAFDKIDFNKAAKGAGDALTGLANTFERNARNWIEKDEREITQLEENIRWKPKSPHVPN